MYIDVSDAVTKLATARTAGFKEVNVRVATDFQRRARYYAPIRTGRLIQQLRVGTTKYKAKINSTVKYAKFQEYGTKYMTAQPYMRPSLQQQHVKKYENWYAERLGELL